MTNQKSSIVKYSLITIFSILLLYSFTKNSNNSLNEIENSMNLSRNKVRNLLDENKVDKVCERASKEVQDFFKEDSEFEEKEYDQSGETTQDLLNIIDGKGDKSKNDSIKSYIFRILPMGFFLVFGILSIAIWPTCVCCMCCCKCCCCMCCFKNCMKMFQIVLFFVSGGAFVLTFIFSTYGLAATNSVFEGIDSTLCTIFRVITEAVNGQKKTTLPKWAGISGVQTILKDLNTKIKGVDGDVYDAFSNSNTALNNAKTQWNSAMNTANSRTSTPSPITVDTPTYVGNTPYNDVMIEFANYATSETPGTFLYQAQTEFDAVTSAVFESLDSAKDSIDNSLSDTRELSEEIESASESITDLQTSFNDLTEKIADPLIEHEELISVQGKTYAKTVFGIIMALCAGMTGIYVIQLINVCSALQCLLKIVTLVVWNLLFLFSIVSFIVSGFIGLIGFVGKDGTALASYLISEENLNSEEPRVLGSGGSNKYLKVCILGDGNLKDELNLGEKMDKFDTLYQLDNDIKRHKTTVSAHQNSVILQTFIDKGCSADKFLSCDFISKNNPTKKYDIKGWLTELNKYTTTSTGSYRSSGYNKEWTETCSTSSCVNIYEAIEDISNTEINTNVDGSTNGHHYNTAKTAAMDIVQKYKDLKSKLGNSFTFYRNGSPNLGGEVNNLNTAFKAVTRTTLNTLEKVSGIITRFTSVLSDYVGDGGSIYSLINCKFIDKDFKFLMKQLNRSIGKNVYNFASVMITMTCFLTLALYASVLYSVATKKVQEESNK